MLEPVIWLDGNRVPRVISLWVRDSLDSRKFENLKFWPANYYVGLKMQNFQAGFELKNFEVGKIVTIGINMRIFLMFERENLKIGYENHTTRLNVLYTAYTFCEQCIYILFSRVSKPPDLYIDG